LVLLKHDLGKMFRVRNVRGKRTEKESFLRRLARPILAITFAVVIIAGIVLVVPRIGWGVIRDLIASDLTIGATLFNFLLLISFIGSIMVSATTVGNSDRMEYLMVMPIRLRTLFLEKTIIVILTNATIWLVIGTPIFVGLSLVSDAPFALLSGPVFLILMLVLVTLGVSLGGLFGLLISRLLAGRRRLKQVGWFIGTAVITVAGVLYYYLIYSSSDFSYLLDWVFQIADALGFSSGISPGYATSVISLGLLVGASFAYTDVILVALFATIAAVLVYTNAYVSEMAHYSGWLASGSKRTSNGESRIAHTSWNPRVLLGERMNTTANVSMWYNIANVRREGRVFAQYLVGPLRLALFYMLPAITGGAAFAGFTPFLIVGVVVVFAASYGAYFAGYETVYEGRNLMNLQLAAANMKDYIAGKVYSAIPFTIVASALATTVIVILSPSLLIYAPALIIGAICISLAGGAIAANAAAMGGDFRAERNIMRQRGSGAQMPIRGWSMLRAQFLPNVIGLMGLSLVLGLGIFVNPLYGYGALAGFGMICYSLFRNYCSSAGRKLSEIEATEYL
jgi:hypothetical protein